VAPAQGEHPYFSTERVKSKSFAIEADNVGLGFNEMVNDMADPFAA